MPTEPIMNLCRACGKEWWGGHVCLKRMFKPVDSVAAAKVETKTVPVQPTSEMIEAARPLDALIRRLRLLSVDHTPDGWPAVQMRDITRVLIALEFYRSRCDMLQREQTRMRDPERVMVCDILANGQLLPDPNGVRYGLPNAGINPRICREQKPE